jgi:hypothetical protein
MQLGRHRSTADGSSVDTDSEANSFASVAVSARPSSSCSTVTTSVDQQSGLPELIQAAARLDLLLTRQRAHPGRLKESEPGPLAAPEESPGTGKNKWINIPICYNGVLIDYRISSLKQAGFSKFPATTDEFLEFAKATKKNNTPGGFCGRTVVTRSIRTTRSY